MTAKEKIRLQKGSVIGYAVILYTCYLWNGELQKVKRTRVKSSIAKA